MQPISFIWFPHILSSNNWDIFFLFQTLQEVEKVKWFGWSAPDALFL